MILSTFSLVAALIRGLSAITRETVDAETLAFFAMSLIVTRNATTLNANV